MKRRTLLTLAATAALAVPAQARADLILLGPISGSGAGLGAQLTVLTLTNPGGSTTESGCVSPTGFVCAHLVGTGGTPLYPNSDVQTGQTQVQLVSQPDLAGLNGSNLRIVLNASEPTPRADFMLNMATVTLYSGTTAVFNGSLAAPLNLDVVGPGTGNVGFLFGLDATQAAAFDAAMMNSTAGPLSIGIGASFSNVSGGLETFYIARATSTQVVPEPATVGLMATGLLGLGGIVMRRRKNA